MLGHTLSPVRQLFERIVSPSAAADAESRFQHFKKHAWLHIKESGSSGNECHNSCKQVSGVRSCSACLCCAADCPVAGLAWALLAACHRAVLASSECSLWQRCNVQLCCLQHQHKLHSPPTASKELTPVLLYRAACLCALLF